ncbi:penicillin-binding transpeptidase domain-containing protein [Sinanaerobacter chloroacetimidivorans]|jgi:penicillin-binding protein 2|uniref:Penicillin-binding protein n=1 Tax=Sinanaerobacter chloroacetimidivorans TaxID=2818044 RepID=A0A8J8B273_9FIRM|nr:penicillin-binding transpeptidase domain-containing protein [Sinanaerobacter chloroacetimidivorans]MBR0599498.1 penicillin-binding protein [Sinanaerobacter chloroacetimidivorans]
MKWLKSRNNQILLFSMVLMSLLGIRLFGLTVVEGAKWDEAASNISIKSIHTSAPRGEILDRYGRVLAGNIPSFTVQISAGDLNNEQINAVSRNLIRILEANGDSYYDNFPILIENGQFYYTYQKDIEYWLAAQGMPVDFTAEQAFEEIKRRQNIDEGLDKYEAQEQLQSVYNIFPPISVKNMKYLKDLDKESFLGRYYLDTDLTAKEAFESLRKKFEISDALSDEEARKIMVVRNELSSQGYRKYMPAKIASGVSNNTIVVIEEKNSDLPGVEVVAESIRYYPNGNTAAHVLGYLGQISESEKAHYVDEMGYKSNDMVGQEGIEKAFESTLKGTDGTKNVEVNAFGELVRVINETTPEKGKDVYLTIDLELQKTAEDALEQALKQIQVAGTFESQWGNYKYGKAFKNANVGAVVALDVETSDVLAMASYPDFDPNLFATGISKEDWNSLQGENLRDPLSPLPLFNVAARTAVQPGSTFKMVTATAALESGLDPTRKLVDGGYVKLGNRTYGCLVWNRNRTTHGLINLYEAIEVSCNYYFFDIATGRDFYKKTSLGLAEPMNIEKITTFAQQYGLGLKTGIEIPETVVPVPSEERKLAQIKTYLKNVLIGRAEIYFKRDIIDNKEKLNEQIKTIVSWTEENPTRNELIERVGKLGIKEDMVETVADLCKFTYFNQAAWTTGDELNISIGQGENAYTPLQMANYVATIGNKGVHNQVSLIKAVEGEENREREPGKKIDISSDETLDHIIEGMKRVVSGSKGSLKGAFTGFPVQVAGKTGTAERAGKINPPDEVEYIKQYLPRINGSLRWVDVETEMYRLLEEYPDVYTSQNSAVRQAVINLSHGKVTTAKLDAYKASYDNFAWVVTLAPADDPKIAVAVLLFQGGTAGYAAPVAREVIAKYLELDKIYNDYNLDTVITQ